jgi:hypothetical protein
MEIRNGISAPAESLKSLNRLDATIIGRSASEKVFKDLSHRVLIRTRFLYSGTWALHVPFPIGFGREPLHSEDKMNISEQIEKHIQELPLDKQREVLDFVLFLRNRSRVETTPESAKNRKEIMRGSLEKLVKMRTFADIGDPVEWQREIRRDRPLPGREE